MWKTAGAKLRDWYIIVIALLLFGGGFFLASHQSPSNGTGRRHPYSRSIARA